MATSFLNQAISQFCGGIIASQQYIFPTVQNLAAGAYISEILDVREVSRDDGSLEAVDFYHKLSDSNGNVIYVRFRHYSKELSSLVSSLKQYPQVQTWQNVIGLQEEITVAQKATGNYMRISSRHAPVVAVTSASTVSTTSLGASATKYPAKNRVGGSRFGSKHRSTPPPTSKASLLLEDDELDGWEDDSDDE